MARRGVSQGDSQGPADPRSSAQGHSNIMAVRKNTGKPPKKKPLVLPTEVDVIIPETQGEGVPPPSCVGIAKNLPPRVQVALKSPRKRPPIPPKQLDLSITISVGSSDIPLDYLQKMEKFLETDCISGLCAIERGGALCRLHIQMVCRIMAASAAIVSKRIKVHLGWNKPATAPVGHHILSKTLRNTGLHTFIGMLGYCIKDRGEDHFNVVHRNVTSQQIEEGVEEYVKHGTPFAKNRVILTHKNLIEKAATFCRYKFKKQLGSTLPGTILPMLQSGQYIPSASWALPVRQGGMEYTRALALWKCMMEPDSVSMDDVTQIFFEHTNPGSRLADLGRQRLATILNDAHEGAPRDYVVPGTILGDTRQQADDVFIVEDSEDVAEPTRRSTSHISIDTDAPMFILVVYGDRDD